MRQIYLAGIPFLACDLVALIIVLLYPDSIGWLVDWVYAK